ncbi:MAG: di-trans,poly-cis-decaprenylcistransferase [Flavobacteriaceae bacterium TMED238]|nr:MAG: di-trans,poly-cis-decaprenylcistransferase [Flavobacteriaceae bacterium TMED238]|tara:strand:- start:309 stop:977 length:669 start_codon:yes stop_codon:yes gene_type:complete
MNKLNHIAFIMDGNGRWGKKKGRGRNFGHLKGVETVKKIVKNSIKLKIPIITFYVFSSENWKRPKKEVNFLFKLIKNYFLEEIDIIIKQGIKINFLGELNKLAPDIKNTLKKSSNLTTNNKKILVNLAINYGSKNEIINALKKSKKKLTIKNVEKNLYTKNMLNPDILIRTGGHKRLSNFLLWQLAYTELFFLNKLWPDFNSNDLVKIINKYKKSKRNFGGI